MKPASDDEVKSWFAFALQKCGELALLRDALNSGETAALEEWSAPIQARRHSRRVHNAAVEKRLATITAQDSQRENPYEVRAEAQRARFKLPAWPTTTIGSFPQTTEIRGLRLDFKKGNLDANNYRTGIAEHIKQAIIEQERLGLDVLVHGEAERNDMVEYFGEHLDGFVFTQNGWVQSYGSRCVKPPVVIGDISRPAPITVEWAKYAQSLTDKPVKGMLTGPVHHPSAGPSLAKMSAVKPSLSRLRWRCVMRWQIWKPQALALFRLTNRRCAKVYRCAAATGTPIWRGAWKPSALTRRWRRMKPRSTPTCVTASSTTLWIRSPRWTADVITIETSRSDMELLESFEAFDYPNEIGPGVYDIHSPNVPSVEWIEALLKKAAQRIPGHNACG
ncbi:5-methyltetrahydropteroyltriglutamate--homocysteine S-methyltransferase [Salmonella bongori]|nr:5-methyltetrahydropteroyltriglutamate--homocysteine S-methyltransferase [Salmonella bongori]